MNDIPEYNGWAWNSFWENIRIDKGIARELGLDNYKLQPKHLREIAEFLTHNQSVKIILFSNNNLGWEGIEYFTTALASNSNTRLESFVFWKNHIGDRGAQAVAQLLMKNSSIKKLSLDDNEITSEGAKAIASALSVNTTLTQLLLSRNQIDDAGAQALLSALATNFNFIHIGLYENPVSKEIEDQILSLEIRNKAIRSEQDPIKKANLIGKAMNTYQAPSLLELGLFAVKKNRTPEELKQLQDKLPKEVYAKLINGS